MPIESPRSRRPLRRRRTDERITAAVTDLLRDGGFQAVTMDAVKNASGVSKATLYSRYSDRIELLEGVAGQVETTEFDTLARNDPFSVSRFEEALDALRAELTDRVGPVLLRDLLLPTDALVEVWREKLIRPAMDRLAALFEQGVDDGALSPDVDHELVIELILGGLVVAGAMHDGVPQGWAHDLALTLWLLISAS